MVTVLIAESTATLRNSISNIIKTNFSTECAVQEVKNRKELFHELYRQHYQVILLDLAMPGLHFREFSDALANSGRKSVLLPMAELSSFDHAAIAQSLIVPDFLLKPFSETELVLTMEEALRSFSLTDRNCHSIGTESEDLSRTDMIRNKIERYIHENYRDIFSMQDVASAMNYSDTHFCRLFKQCFQVTFSVYMNEFRVKKAKELLENTNYTVKEVGIFCGYRDTSYFIRVFKRFTGMTPSDYRITKLIMTAK